MEGQGGGAGRECEAGSTSLISQFKLEDCGTRNELCFSCFKVECH